MSDEISKDKNILKSFARYVSLNVIAMLGLSLYILADTFFISFGMGATGLAALNIALPVYSLMYGLGLMFGMGGATLFAKYKAKGEAASANAVFTHVFFITLAIGVLLSAIGFVFCGEISALLGANDETFEYTSIYIKTVVSFAPFFIINNALMPFLRNDGAPRLSMAGMLAGSLSNILLDYIFIFPLKLGMLGAAIATCFAPAIGIFIMSFHFIKKKNSFKIIKCKLDFKKIFAIVKIGVPNFITEISGGIVIFAFNLVILTISGNVGVAAYGVVANIALVIISLLIGISQGAQPLMTENFALGKKRELGALFISSVITTFAFSVAIYLVLFFGAKGISDIFNYERNLNLTALAVEGMRLYSIGYFLAGLNIIIGAYFAAVFKAAQAFTITFLRGLGFILPLIFLLGKTGGMTGVWLAFPAAEALTFIVTLIFVLVYRKNSYKIENSPN